MNGKAKRISKKLTPLQRAKAKAAAKAKRNREQREQVVPEFLKRVMPDDEPEVFVGLPPDITPGPSGQCGGGVRYYTKPELLHPKPERGLNVFQSIAIWFVSGYRRVLAWVMA